MKSLLEAGCAGFFTDYPERAAAVKKMIFP
jgi:glycerophosphoryl diester phosphodiesterase